MSTCFESNDTDIAHWSTSQPGIGNYCASCHVQHIGKLCCAKIITALYDWNRFICYTTVKATTVHNVFVLLKLVPSVFLKQIVVTRMKTYCRQYPYIHKDLCRLLLSWNFSIAAFIIFSVLPMWCFMQAKSCDLITCPVNKI